MNKIISLFLIMFIFVIPVHAATNILYSESFLFSGGGTFTETPAAGGGGGTVTTDPLGTIKYVGINFNNVKTPTVIILPSLVAGFGGPRDIFLSAGANGINTKFTPFVANISGTFVGSGSVGWRRIGVGTDFNYEIYFDTVDTAYTSTLTGFQQVNLYYNRTEIIDPYITGTTSGTEVPTVTSGATYVYGWVVGHYGTNGLRYSVTANAVHSISFSVNDLVTATLMNNSGITTSAYYNITKSNANIRLVLTNYTGIYTYYDTTSTADVSQYVLTGTGLVADIYHVSLLQWANRSILGPTGQTITPTPPPIPGQGGSAYGQVFYNYSSSVRGNAYSLTANVTTANFSSLDEYALYAYDASGNIVPGFPTKFYTQNYTTGTMFVFTQSGTYHTNLTRCNTVCRAGAWTGLISPVIIDTASVYVINPVGVYSITTDKASYLPQQTINITVSRPVGVKVWVTALDNNGLTFPEIANNLVFDNGINSQFVTLPSDIGFGNYSLNMFISNDGTNQVATTSFNIGISAGTLNVVWDGAELAVGTFANLKSSTALNASLLNITDPLGHSVIYNMSANTVNITSVYLNLEGYWIANITDIGNASNTSQSILHAYDDGGANETLTQCKSKGIYVCWDKTIYTQGERYNIYFKTPLAVCPLCSFWLKVYNPNMVDTLTTNITAVFDPITATYTGSIHGVFSPTGTLGYYTAVSYTRDIFGTNTTRATSRARLDPVSTATSTAQTGTTLAGTTSIVMNLPWIGLMLLIVIIFGLVKNGVNTGLAMFIIALTTSIEAVLGLWGAWAIYITILSWLLVGVFFRFRPEAEA